MNCSDITGIIMIALDLTAKELSQITGEPHTQIKERLIVMAVQQSNQMTTEQVTEWIKSNYPIPPKVKH